MCININCVQTKKPAFEYYYLQGSETKKATDITKYQWLLFLEYF